MYTDINFIDLVSCKILLSLANSLSWKTNKGRVVDYKTCSDCVDLLSGFYPLHNIWPLDDWYSAMFINIPAGGKIKKHGDGHGRDQDIRGEYSKYHIPLQTNDHCVSRTWDKDGNSTDYHLKVGRVYKMDNELPHESWNQGSTDRIHLVMEIYD